LRVPPAGVPFPLMSGNSRKAASRRLQLTLEMFDFGVQLFRENLRREHPGLGGEEIEGRVRRWLQTRPGAVDGDAVGRRRPIAR
jgi:hypothetical protein